MAQILYSNQVSGMSGKLNGSVHTRNRGGNVIRTKVTPRNPNTTYQATQRSYQGQLAQTWSGTLTDAERAAWSKYGATAPTIGAFGNPRPLAGNTAFIQVNRIILVAGGTIITSPPTSKDITGLTALGLVANHTGPALTLSFAPTPLSAPEGIYLFATPAISPGISNVSAQLRFIGFTSAATSTLNILSAWEARFGTFPAAGGQRIAVAAQIVNSTTGANAPTMSASTLIL